MRRTKSSRPRFGIWAAWRIRCDLAHRLASWQGSSDLIMAVGRRLGFCGTASECQLKVLPYQVEEKPRVLKTSSRARWSMKVTSERFIPEPLVRSEERGVTCAGLRPRRARRVPLSELQVPNAYASWAGFAGTLKTRDNLDAFNVVCISGWRSGGARHVALVRGRVVLAKREIAISDPASDNRRNFGSFHGLGMGGEKERRTLLEVV
ncbi:hypothetical protein VTK26DRAFT_1986 [Humicola hyalothermophila]